MKYLLDTNTCIQYLRGKNASILAHFAARMPVEIAVSSVVVAELRYGAERANSPAAEHVKVDSFVAQYTSLPFDDQAAARFGRVRADLHSRGLAIGPYDTMIAAIALVHGLTLVTNNTREFSRVPGLTLVDWEQP